METLFAVLAIVVIIALAVRKIIVEKKKGAKCVGCPACSNGGCSSSHK